MLLSDMLLVCKELIPEDDVEMSARAVPFKPFLQCEQIVRLQGCQVLDTSTPAGSRSQLLAVGALLQGPSDPEELGSRSKRIRSALVGSTVLAS